MSCRLTSSIYYNRVPSIVVSWHTTFTARGSACRKLSHTRAYTFSLLAHNGTTVSCGESSRSSRRSHHTCTGRQEVEEEDSRVCVWRRERERVCVSLEEEEEEESLSLWSKQAATQQGDRGGPLSLSLSARKNPPWLGESGLVCYRRGKA